MARLTEDRGTGSHNANRPASVPGAWTGKPELRITEFSLRQCYSEI